MEMAIGGWWPYHAGHGSSQARAPAGRTARTRRGVRPDACATRSGGGDRPDHGPGTGIHRSRRRLDRGAGGRRPGGPPADGQRAGQRGRRAGRTRGCGAGREGDADPPPELGQRLLHRPEPAGAVPQPCPGGTAARDDRGADRPQWTVVRRAVRGKPRRRRVRRADRPGAGTHRGTGRHRPGGRRAGPARRRGRRPRGAPPARPGTARHGRRDAVHAAGRDPPARPRAGPGPAVARPGQRDGTAGGRGGRGAARVAAGTARGAGGGRAGRRAARALPGVHRPFRGTRAYPDAHRPAGPAAVPDPGARRLRPGGAAERGEALAGQFRRGERVRAARRGRGQRQRRRGRAAAGVRRPGRTGHRGGRRAAGSGRRYRDPRPRRGRRSDGAGVAAEVIHVLVVDDHPIVLDGVTLALHNTSWLRVAGYARSGKEAIAALRTLRPDVVLLDLRLPDMLGPEAVQALRAGDPAVKVIMFTAYPDHAALDAALAAGAHGVVVKDSEPAELVDVIARVLAGERVGSVDGSVGTALNGKLREHGLTRREYDILRRVAMGETNPEIAAALGLTRNTVKTYLQRTLEKLGARNRVEALSRASQLGIL